MSFQPSFGTIESAAEPLAAPKANSPFRIAMLADFSGRHNRGVIGTSDEIATRRLLRVGRDTLDEVMAKLEVQLKLPVGEDGDVAELSFASLDDFHPDQIHDRVALIADTYDEDDRSALMNSVLHHPDFQALESAWRGLDWLLSRAAKGCPAEVQLLDLSLAELAADLKSSDNLAATGLYRLLIEKGVHGPQGEPWAMLVGDYIFEPTGEHAELLGRLAKIACQTLAPFLSTVHPQMLDKSFRLNEDAAPAWQELRLLPEAALLGLAVPRFLLRLPYGADTKSIDKFSYEEMAKPPNSSHYLWGNPALACAALLALAYRKEGWGLLPGVVVDLDDLPMHVYTVDGEQEVTLAEAWLVRPQTEQLAKQGIMPFLCVRGEGRIQVARFFSVGQPAAGQPPSDLYGRWNLSGLAPVPPPGALPLPAATVGFVGEMPAKPKPGAKPPAPPPARPVKPPPGAVTAAPAPPAPPPAPAPAEVAPEVAEPQAPTEPEPDFSAPAADEAAAPAAEPEVPPAEAEAAPAEEELDPELAALLKQLE